MKVVFENVPGGRTDNLADAPIMGAVISKSGESRIRERSTQQVANLFKINICGVNSVKDAQLVGLAGADAVGLIAERALGIAKPTPA